MKNLLLLTVLTMVFYTGWANKIEAKLIGESQDGNTVKLMWFVKKWDKSLTGFNIKRKTAGNEWVTINSEIIVPEISLDKNLQVVENSTEELLRLKSKLKNLLDKGTLQLSDAQSFSNTLSDNNALKNMSRSFGQDFDLALISGFGMTDRNIQEGTEQYGLFLVKNNEEDKIPAATFDWSYGEKANINHGIKISWVNSDNGVQLLWNLPFESIKKIHAKGFNVYKKDMNGWVKINETPITEFDNVKNGYTFYDNNLSNDEVVYAITVATMFNNEGKKNEFLVVNKQSINNDLAKNHLRHETSNK